VIIGIPKELKDHEERVALLPEAVKALVDKGHSVLVQKDAGRGCGYPNKQYREAGAKIIPKLRDIYRNSQMVVKVKEPLLREYAYFREGLRIFCFLHLAANQKLTRALVKANVSALAFETLEDKRGATPLLRPMSEIAGRLSALIGANYLRTDQGGKGILLSSTAYSEPGRVTVIGGGNVGRAAAEVAAGLGAYVEVYDLYPQHLGKWAKAYSNIELIKSTPTRIIRSLRRADLVVGAVYIPGARTPQVIRKSMVKEMEEGSVLIDVAVDQGGASETTHATSISKPIYRRYGVIHCAIPNLPTLACRTASQMLSRVISPYVLKIAGRRDFEKILRDRELSTSVNVYGGKVVHPEVQASMEKN